MSYIADNILSTLNTMWMHLAWETSDFAKKISKIARPGALAFRCTRALSRLRNIFNFYFLPSAPRPGARISHLSVNEALVYHRPVNPFIVKLFPSANTIYLLRRYWAQMLLSRIEFNLLSIFRVQGAYANCRIEITTRVIRT